MKKLLIYFFMLSLFYCSDDKEQISKLLPKKFNIVQSEQNINGIPSKVKIYTFDKQILNYNQIKDFPIEIKEDGWSFKKWHLVTNEKELKNLFAMLDYPIVVNNKNNDYAVLVKSLKSSLKDKKAYVSYYYRKKDGLNYYVNGYIQFYCLQPKKHRIVHISFGDL